MKIELIDINYEFAPLQEVSSPKILFRGKFDSHGLFSEQIFGCTEDFKCQCGRYFGKEYVNKICENCGVRVTNSNVRLTTFAKITVPETTILVNPIVLELLMKCNIKMCDVKLDNLIVGKEKAIIKDNRIIKSNSEDANYGPMFFKEEIIPILKRRSKAFKQFFKLYEDKMFIKFIPVIPPDTRPITAGNTPKQFFIDKINEYYLRIIRKINNIKMAPFIPDRAHASLQEDLNQLFDALLNKFEHKNGFLRAHVLGKRVDYSGRAVIVVDGEKMPLGYCKIPYKIAKEVYKPQIIPIVSKRMKLSPLTILTDYDKKYLKDEILKALKDRFLGTYVILNRQPSLHRASVQSMKIYDIIEDDVIVIHPLITEAYNADFDGDQMAVYVPHSIAKKDAREKMWMDNNIRLPSNNEISLKFKQDMVLGLHEITKKEEDDFEFEYLNNKTIPGRMELFKKVMPEQYQTEEFFKLFNVTLDKKTIQKLIDKLEKKLPVNIWIDVVDKLCRIGFENSHATLSIRDFIVDPEKEPNNNAIKMITSGARGSWDQYKQIAVSKGFISDVTGRVIPKEIKNSLIKGLTPEEYFITCYGGRKGLIDTADNTAKSGYLTRKLVYLLSPLMLDTEVEDCHKELGNTKYFNFYVRDEKVAKSLIGRYMNGGLITEDNYQDIIEKTIELRSPITCTANGICKKCYGELYKTHKSKNIGIISAQSLGERTTQLTLRTKHISGSTENNFGELNDFLKMEDNTLIAKQNGTIIINDDNIEFNFEGMDYTFENYENFELLLEDPEEEEQVYVDDEMNILEENEKSNKIEIDFKEGDKIATVDITSKDIVSAVSMLTSLLNKPPEDGNIELEDYLYQILDIYGAYATIDLIHFECILAMLARDITDDSLPFRKSKKNKHKILGMIKVISKMPEQALAFERFSFYLKKYLLGEEDSTTESNFSLLRALMFFEFDYTDIMEKKDSKD